MIMRYKDSERREPGQMKMQFSRRAMPSRILSSTMSPHVATRGNPPSYEPYPLQPAGRGQRPALNSLGVLPTTRLNIRLMC